MDELRFYELDTLGDSEIDDRLVLDNFVAEMEDEVWRLLKGEPAAEVWPADARIYLTGDEDGLDFGEFIANTENVIVAGRQFVKLIRKHCKGVPIEFLPISIYDHRKRLLTAEHVVVNPIGSCDCVDLERSDVLWGKGKTKKVLSVDDLVIDRKRGAEAPQLFRPEHARSTYVMRFELTKAIKDADLRNVVWTKLDVSG